MKFEAKLTNSFGDMVILILGVGVQNGHHEI